MKWEPLDQQQPTKACQHAGLLCGSAGLPKGNAEHERSCGLSGLCFTWFDTACRCAPELIAQVLPHSGLAFENGQLPIHHAIRLAAQRNEDFS